MQTVIVASTNPVKIQAARQGFALMFPGQDFEFVGVSAPSGVSDQPMTSAETLQGATNRARAIQQMRPEADFWVGIEGGVEEGPNPPRPSLPIVGKEGVEEQAGPAELPVPNELAVFAWIVVLSKDRSGRGQTGVFFLPPRVAELVHQGIELGVADDMVFGRTNSKQGNGAVGLLTSDVIDRTEYYVHAVVLALIPFKNAELYPGDMCSASPDGGKK